MRSCTPGKESALSVKTVPRIRKSFAWLYFCLPFADDEDCGEEASADGETGAGKTANGASSAAAHKATTHRTCMIPLLKSLDGSRQERRCLRSGRVRRRITLHLLPHRHPLLFSLGGHHFRQIPPPRPLRNHGHHRQ